MKNSADSAAFVLKLKFDYQKSLTDSALTFYFLFTDIIIVTQLYDNEMP